MTGKSRKADVAGRLLKLHMLSMRSVSFMPIEADLIAANRLHFWSSLKWKRTVWSYALGALVFALVGTPLVGLDSDEGMVLGATLGLIFWSLLLTGILAVNYALIPPRSRRAFQQMKALQGQTDIIWSPERIQLQSMQGSTDLDWRDFVRITLGQDVTLLFQSDYLFNFIPTRALSTEQVIDLRNLATSRRA